MKPATICFLIRPDEGKVLLGLKKTGFGRGKYNGFGGKVQPGESFTEGAAREILEESGLVVDAEALFYQGELWFIYPGNPADNHHAAIFTTTAWSGKPCETEEMRPQWFSFDEVPYDHMWQDDRHWLPGVLSGGTIRAEVLFELDGETIAEFRVLPNT